MLRLLRPLVESRLSAFKEIFFDTNISTNFALCLFEIGFSAPLPFFYGFCVVMVAAARLEVRSLSLRRLDILVGDMAGSTFDTLPSE